MIKNNNKPPYKRSPILSLNYPGKNETVSPLTRKQEQFCFYYIGAAEFNATKAALLAGYSKRSAGNQGARLIKKDEIRARIDEILHAKGFNDQFVINRLLQIACADVYDFISIQKGEVKLKAKPPSGYAIKSIRVSPKSGVYIELEDRMRALELLGKALGIFKVKRVVWDIEEMVDESINSGPEISEAYHQLNNYIIKVCESGGETSLAPPRCKIPPSFQKLLKPLESSE